MSFKSFGCDSEIDRVIQLCTTAGLSLCNGGISREFHANRFCVPLHIVLLSLEDLISLHFRKLGASPVFTQILRDVRNILLPSKFLELNYV